jgi:hypothetical protein
MSEKGGLFPNALDWRAEALKLAGKVAGDDGGHGILVSSCEQVR